MKLRSKNTEKWRNKIYEENPSDGIQKSLVCSMGMVLIQSMQKSIDGNTYGDTTTIEIAVTKDSDGQYGISDSDMEKISTALFPGSV